MNNPMYPYKVVLCGCTKNSASYLTSHLYKLVQIKDLFSSFEVVLYENDSYDMTVQILDTYQQIYPFVHYISETGIDKKYRHRPERIAHGRNKILHHIQTNFPDYDFMMMMDLDGVVDNFEIDQFKHIFEHDVNTWDVLTANCNNRYYDIWALRIEETTWNNELHGKVWPRCIDYDCWERILKTMDKKSYLADNQVWIPQDTPLIPVDSAFGGFGIYKMSHIKDCTYSAHLNGNVSCEHVEFHKQIREKHNARIFICPSFCIQCQTEHLV
jgi:hypothetical protein